MFTKLMAPRLVMAYLQRRTPSMLWFSTVYSMKICPMLLTIRREHYLHMPNHFKAARRWRFEHPLHYSLGKFWVIPTIKLTKNGIIQWVYTTNKNEIMYISLKCTYEYSNKLQRIDILNPLQLVMHKYWTIHNRWLFARFRWKLLPWRSR